MDDVSLRGPALTAALILAWYGLHKYRAWLKQRADEREFPLGSGDFVVHVGRAPWGSILKLSAPEESLLPDSVHEVLQPYMDGALPHAALVVDFRGAQYLWSAKDLGSVAGSIAPSRRGWVVPCAIVTTGRAAHRLQEFLDRTSLKDVAELRIVGTVDSAMVHVDQHARWPTQPEAP